MIPESIAQNLVIYLMDEATVRSQQFSFYYDQGSWTASGVRAVGMETWAKARSIKYLKYEAQRDSEASGAIPTAWVLGFALQDPALSQIEQQFQQFSLTFDLEVALDSKLCPNDCSKTTHGTIGYCSSQLLRCICLTSYDGDDCAYFMPDLRYESKISQTISSTGWIYAKLTFVQSSQNNIFLDIESYGRNQEAYILQEPSVPSVTWQEIPSDRYFHRKIALSQGVSTLELPLEKEGARVFIAVKGEVGAQVIFSTHYPSGGTNQNLIIILFFVGFIFLALWICLMFIKYTRRRRRRRQVDQQENQQDEAQEDRRNQLRYKVERYYPSITQLEARAVYVLLRKYRAPPEQCVICLDPFRLDQEVRMMSCLHFFHTKCIDEWFKKNSTCPCCNRDFNRRANLMFNANEFVKIDQYDKRKMEDVPPRLTCSFAGWVLRRERPVRRHSCPALDFKALTTLAESPKSHRSSVSTSQQRSELLFRPCQRPQLDQSIDQYSPVRRKSHIPLFASQRLKVKKQSFYRSKNRTHVSDNLNFVRAKAGFETSVLGKYSFDHSRGLPLSKHSMYPEEMQNIISSMRSSNALMQLNFTSQRRNREMRSLMNLSGMFSSNQPGGMLSLKQKHVSSHTLNVKFAGVVPQKAPGTVESLSLLESITLPRQHRTTVEERKKDRERGRYQQQEGPIQTTFENYMNEIEHINNETVGGATPFAEISGIDKLRSADRGAKFKFATTTQSKRTTNVLVLSNQALFESTETQNKTNPRASQLTGFMEAYRQVMQPAQEYGQTMTRKSRIFPKQELGIMRESAQLISPRRPVYTEDKDSFERVGLEEAPASKALLEGANDSKKKPLKLLHRKLYDAVNMNTMALGKATPRLNEAVQQMTPRP